jgi:hypothetical protein
MNIKKLAKNKTVRAIGWVAIVLLCLSFWAYVSGIRNIISLVLGYGVLMLLGMVGVLIFNLLTPKMKHTLLVIGVGAILSGIASIFITMAQERIFKIPHRFGSQVWLGNSITGTLLFMLGRSQGRNEEEDDRDS